MEMMKDPLYTTWQGWIALVVFSVLVIAAVTALYALIPGLVRPTYWFIVGGAIAPWIVSVLVLLLVGHFSKGQRDAIVLLTTLVPMLGIIATLVISSIATLFVSVSTSAKIAGLRASMVSGVAVSVITIAVCIYFRYAYVSSMADYLPGLKDIKSHNEGQK
jgi:hypothetical protein